MDADHLRHGDRYTDSNLVMAIEAGGDDFISKTVAENVLQAKMKAMSRIAALTRPPFPGQQQIAGPG